MRAIPFFYRSNKNATAWQKQNTLEFEDMRHHCSKIPTIAFFTLGFRRPAIHFIAYGVLQKFVNAHWFGRLRSLTQVLPQCRQNRATAPSTAQTKAFRNFCKTL